MFFLVFFFTADITVISCEHINKVAVYLLAVYEPLPKARPILDNTAVLARMWM